MLYFDKCISRSKNRDYLRKRLNFSDYIISFVFFLIFFVQQKLYPTLKRKAFFIWAGGNERSKGVPIKAAYLHKAWKLQIQQENNAINIVGWQSPGTSRPFLCKRRAFHLSKPRSVSHNDLYHSQRTSIDSKDLLPERNITEAFLSTIIKTKQEDF